ncbi:restriction endonuclease subunit S [Acetobacter senegalensis]|uniref:restriction endonuclease subunit S n=1 Tax=Acetobacter senegalensis TaxID=446692 RepID=UPI001EDA45C7|nr:restriction endonuclease subunit S [Acetobacter senegalensis]MCG4254106.1 restriction endonuclease subunit S [Acetobacter senegalensis]
MMLNTGCLATGETRFTPHTLGEVIELKRGYDLPSKDRIKGQYPIISSSGISGSHSDYQVEGPGVVTGRYGTLGQIFYEKENFWPLNTTLYVKDFKGNHPKFIYYFLKTLDFWAFSDKAAVPGLNRNDLHTANILFPNDVYYQKSVASILSSLDDKIDLNRRTNETLEAMARALFRDWFIDFGPTRAKMAGETPYLAPELWELFPKRLDDEGKPEGWELQRLHDILEFNYGKSLPTQKRIKGEIPVYGSGGVTGLHNEALVTTPTIIVGRKGTVGALYWENRSCFPIDTVFYVTSKLPLSYCFYLLETLGLENMNTDAAVPGLNRDNAYRLEMFYPPAVLIGSFANIVENWRNKIFTNESESHTLAQLRDLLLPKLMSGEISIRDAEKMVEDAA